MSYEEKLNLAKEALESGSYDKETIEYIFPELRESDGEKIRKSILTGLIDCRDAPDLWWSDFGGIPIDDCIAWLEKQGEQNPYSGVSFKYNGHTWGMCARDNGVEILFDGELKAFLSSEKSFIYPIHPQPDLTPKNAMEAIKEEKVDNANKVEPNFKVGDWVVDNCGYTWKIGGILNQFYILEGVEGGESRPTIEWVDETCHLWTLKDAKDGDVLVDEDNNIGLYRGEKDNCWESYIYLGCNNYLYGPNIGGYHERRNTKPATKEQRDLLFKKMKEAGYKWDSEKKELNEIEPKFKVGDWVVTKDGKVNQVADVKRIDDEHFGYTLDDETYFSGSWESSYHLWTIQDAKDGDVLAVEDENFATPFVAIYKSLGDTVYKGLRDNITFNSRCFIGFNGNFYTGEEGHAIEDIHPATKEQRDLLFSKMKEAGYEWNTEKKKLGKRVIDEGKAEIDYCFTKMMNGEKINPAWSEDDENMLKSIIATCELAEQDRDSSPARHLFEMQSNWLKTLKDRVQPQPQKKWREEDEWYLKSVISRIKEFGDSSVFGLINNDIQWLKTIKQRLKGE